MPYVALAIMAASLVSLVTAVTLQHVFEIQPCILCIFQRGPYAASLFLATLAYLFKKNDVAVKTLLSLTALSFLINVGIAGFHSGVERGMWQGTNSCEVTPIDGKLAFQEMSAADLLATAAADCDEIPFAILGISLANVNVFFCFGLALFALQGAFGFVQFSWLKEGKCRCFDKDKTKE